MKKLLVISAMLVCITQQVVLSQSPITFAENFDASTVIFNASPSSAWGKDSNYYLSPPYSYLGMVPNAIGDTTILQTPIYDFTGMDFVMLRFSHICKVSPQDTVLIQYRETGHINWVTIPAYDYYMGKAINYASTGFNASSYTEWQASDSLALPQASWWKAETFDMGSDMNNGQFEFRFVIKHGTVTGTQVSYGWLLENFQLTAATHELCSPIVEFVAPLIRDTVYSAGAWEINAKVKTATHARIEPPWLKYTATYNGSILITDSILMTNVQGDSLWKTSIPQIVLGANVSYSITGIDTTGNQTTSQSGYFIFKRSVNDTSVALQSIDSPQSGPITAGAITPLRITIRNKGTQNLTSCRIDWTLNGVSKPPHTYTGNLLGDFSDTVTIGYYTPVVLEQIDTIVVWTSLPNGVTDFLTTDDTLTITTFGCPTGGMSGDYVVGTSGVAQIPTLAMAFNVINECGINGKVTFALEAGTYPGTMNLSSIANTMNVTDTFILTSVSGNAQDVIIQSTGVGITLGNNRNIVIKDLTIDVTSGTYGIQFSSACTNIVIRDCRILASPTTNATTCAPIYKASGTGIADSIFIINNLLDGGYYGLFFYGGTGTAAYGTHIVFDSNTVSNQYFYGVNAYYTDFTSCSYNSILSRQSGTIYATWCGLNIQYSNGPFVGNRIRQRSTTITMPYGINCQYYNYYFPYPNPNLGLITNNEIILYTTSAQYGININNYTRANISHNSIYISGTGAARGIYIANSTYNNLEIKNNNIVLASTSAYPVFFSATGNLNLYDMDYNNYYAPTYVGYYGGNITTVTAWQTQIPTDQHSVNILPTFTDVTTSLELSNYTGLHCSSIISASSDMLGVYRSGITTMGAYHGLPPFNGDAMLTGMSTLRVGLVFGQTDNISVEVYNRGTTLLTSINLEWSVNGVSQVTGGANYPVSLNYGESATIMLGQLSYPAGNVDVRVWINNLNNGTLQDDYLTNDTLQASTYVCVAPLSGTYTIGTTGTFPSWSVAIEQAAVCGVSGDVVFAFQQGAYTHVLDFTNNTSLFANYNVSITSTTGNAADVIFRPASGAGVVLNNTRNLTLKAITIDVSTLGTPAVQFTAACTNIVIQDCRLLGNTTTTTNTVTNAPISKANGTGIADSIFIINNLLDGGYSGFYFYAGTANAAYGTHIVFDSNTVSNQYYYGVYAYYTDFTSCSYNSILSRQSGTVGTTWYGLNIYYSNGTAVGNRIRQRSTTITMPYGISCLYYNYYFPNPNPNRGLIANNEVILNTISSYYGIYANTCTRAIILHNSIYISGTGAARGIYIANSTDNKLVIKNNNIVLTSISAHPVYFSDTGNLILYDMDYNNYYAPTYVGYYGGNLFTMVAWQTQIPTDMHSVSILPTFTDVTTSLELTDYTGLYCFRFTDVPANIHGDARHAYTTMGAYGVGVEDKYDLALSTIVSPANSSNARELCLPDYTPVRFELLNTGIEDHDLFTDPITLHFSIAVAPNIAAFDTLVLLDTGSLKMQQKQVFELMSNLDVSHVGTYAITGWITNAKDTIQGNDTLRTVYQNARLWLPIDEDFSGGIPATFSVRADNTPAVWQQIAQGTGADAAVLPVFGTGMLSFVGGQGAMSTLSTIQIDLSGTVQPALSFWYFHDNIPAKDYTDVQITVDGGATYTTLLSLTKYDTTYGWKEYNVDLSPYANHSCVILAFEAMEKTPSANVVQYIDRIFITSASDLAVSEIIIPELSVCDMNNKELKVVIHSVTNQAIDLSGSQLAVEIPNYSGSPVIIPFPHTPLAGNAYDTITLPNLVDLDTGNYTIKAYVTTPIDNLRGNDTANYTIDIRPMLSVRAIEYGSQASPSDAGIPIHQMLTISNTGNVDLSDIRIRVRILVNAQTDTILEETLTSITIAAGDSLRYTLNSTYFVAWTSIYGVFVEAMGCDSAKIYASTSINEYVNTDDLELLRIDNPPVNELDTVGKQVYVKITLRNNSLVNFFTNIKVTVELRGSNNAVIGLPYAEPVPDIPILSGDTSFTFAQAYTVPNDSVYTLTVFISDLYGNPLDHFRNNDTVRETRNTFNPNVGITETDATRISMSQNIPNPSNGTTRIDYSLPTDGEVTFHVYTISGQELFNQVVETTSGKHSIELNTTSLAAGVYFYSMEFKGQRIVKRMSVAL